MRRSAGFVHRLQRQRQRRFQFAAQPLVQRVLLVAQVPDHVHGQTRAGQRHLGAGQPAQQVGAQQAGQGGQGRAAAQESGHAGKARHFGHETALHALLGEVLVDVQRAGFINKDFDLQFMESLLHNPSWATQFSIEELVEKTGTQGVELLMWLATRAALGDAVRKVHSNYHIPISNTASGLMALEPA